MSDFKAFKSIKRKKGKDKARATYQLYGKYSPKATRIREAQIEARKLKSLSARVNPVNRTARNRRQANRGNR
jgi:hypothetical protein